MLDETGTETPALSEREKLEQKFSSLTTRFDEGYQKAREVDKKGYESELQMEIGGAKFNYTSKGYLVAEKTGQYNIQITRMSQFMPSGDSTQKFDIPQRVPNVRYLIDLKGEGKFMYTEYLDGTKRFEQISPLQNTQIVDTSGGITEADLTKATKLIDELIGVRLFNCKPPIDPMK